LAALGGRAPPRGGFPLIHPSRRRTFPIPRPIMGSSRLRKWADKYNISIKVQRFDYAPSLDAFVAKNIDACTMTNMEALDMPAASGVPTTAIIIGDYSNGNDALLVRNGLQMKDLPGKKLLLVQKTVSEYLLDRALTMNGMRDQIKQVRLINTSDSDIATAFLSDNSAAATVNIFMTEPGS